MTNVTPRERPFDFAETAVRMTNAALMAHYRAGQHTVTRWRSESGIAPASKGGKTPEAPPADFKAWAAGKSIREMTERYGRCKVTVTRWLDEVGITSRVKTGVPKREMPADFAASWARMSQLELTGHYSATQKIIQRWTKEAGLHRTPSARPSFALKPVKPPQLVTFHAAPVEMARDMSQAGMAADYLRQFGAVYRCNERGSPSPGGKMWRRGTAVLSDAELIERADWMRARRIAA